jgi:hypothetical protein
MKVLRNNWKWLVPAIVIAIIGGFLTINAGEVSAAKQGDSNMYHRYGTLSTTPVTDLDKSNGVTSNIQTQLDAKASSSLANANAFVGNGSGVATARSVTIINDVTATMDNTGVLNATIPASTITSSMIVDNSVSSSDILNGTILSTDIAIANVQATDVFINTVTANIVAGRTGIDTTVEAGSILIDTQPVSGFSNIITINKSIVTTDGTWILNTSDSSSAAVVNGIFIRP